MKEKDVGCKMVGPNLPLGRSITIRYRNADGKTADHEQPIAGILDQLPFLLVLSAAADFRFDLVALRFQEPLNRWIQCRFTHRRYSNCLQQPEIVRDEPSP